MELETLNLLSAARPDHGVKKAIEVFLRIKQEKQIKKCKPQGEQLAKYTEWISAKEGGDYRNDCDFSRSC